MITFLAASAVAVSGLNTALLLVILKSKDARIAALTAALLHTVGETRAAQQVVAPDVRPKEQAASAAPPYRRNRQIGMTPR